MNLSPGALIPPSLSRRGHTRSSANDNECVPGKLGCPLSMHACKQSLQVNENATHIVSLVNLEVAVACLASILSYCVVS
jgi:hypothetical protein